MHTILKNTIRDLERRGHRVVQSKGSHYTAYHKDGVGRVILPHSVGGGRWERNMQAVLKRQGFLA